MYFAYNMYYKQKKESDLKPWGVCNFKQMKELKFLYLPSNDSLKATIFGCFILAKRTASFLEFSTPQEDWKYKYPYDNVYTWKLLVWSLSVSLSKKIIKNCSAVFLSHLETLKAPSF